MEDLNENDLGFLESNSLFNDELTLNTISHDYIKNEDDLFLTNDDENWLSGLDNVNSFNHHQTASLTAVSNQLNQNCSINHNITNEHDSIIQNRITSSDQNSILIKKKRKLDLYENSNASFINGLLDNEVDNVIEISDLEINQTECTKINYKGVVVKQENQSVDEKMDKMSLKAAKLCKSIKQERLDNVVIKEDDDLEDYATDQDDLDEDEEIDELLKFPISSSILDDQCGSPTDHLNQHLINDSDSGSSQFDDGYLSSATSTNFNLNSNNQLLADSSRRQFKSTNVYNQIVNDQLYQQHNYSCIKQDKFLHSANNNGQQQVTNGNQLIYLKHDGLLNGNYTSSNSSLSGGSNSSSPTQSPNARKSNYARRPLNKDEKLKLRANGNLNKIEHQQQQQQPATGGRGSRSKPITDLHLTDEERRLLNKEGYHDFPMGDNPQLNKMEEKILRKIRRKIRNKRSAQHSRQRKKEYLEELEKKYSKSTNESQCLKSELQSLKSEFVRVKRENVLLKSKLQKFVRSVDQQQQQQMSNDQQSFGSNEKICDLTAWTTA